MDLFNLPKKCRENAILYYCGSFDPAHEGHLSTLQSAMEKTKAAGAVVIVSKGENSNKPNRSPWEIRRQTAIQLFKNSDNVCVSPWGKEITKKYLLERAHVINLMGEDIWEKYCKRTKSDFPGICIGLRYNRNINYVTNLKDKEIIYTIPEVQGCSSSKIRSYLKSHPEIYKEGLLLTGTILDRLSSGELEYIIKNKLYYQPKNSYSEGVLLRIHRCMTTMFSFIIELVNAVNSLKSIRTI